MVQPPKKKIVVKVKPYTGGKKPAPSNGGKGSETPVDVAPPVVKKKGFLAKCVEVVKEDIHHLRFKTEAITEETPPGWEDYVRFLELAKKK